MVDYITKGLDTQARESKLIWKWADGGWFSSFSHKLSLDETVQDLQKHLYGHDGRRGVLIQAPSYVDFERKFKCPQDAIDWLNLDKAKPKEEYRTPNTNAGNQGMWDRIQAQPNVEASNAQRQSASESSPPAQAKPIDEQIPRAPAAFNSLQDLSQARLDLMRGNPIAIDDWLYEHDTVRMYSDRSEKLRETLTQMAIELQLRESELNDLLPACEQSASTHKERVESVNKYLALKNDILKRESPEILAQALATKAQEDECSAGQILQSVIDKPGTLDKDDLLAFKQQYLQIRVSKHKRSALQGRLVAC